MKIFFLLSLSIFLLGCSQIDSLTPKDTLSKNNFSWSNLSWEVPRESRVSKSWSGVSWKWKKLRISNTVYNREKLDPNPILMNDLHLNRVYLMLKNGDILHEWNLGDKKLWNDIFLLPNGILLASLKASKPSMFPWGLGGVMQLLDQSWSVLWNYDLSNNESISHHDIEILPNGNILAMVWDRIDADTAKEIGYKLPIDIFSERIIEIDPKNNTIVWEWKSLDHIIQDTNPKLPKYGNISKYPEKIDINYSQSLSGMVMHANGISYDSKNNLIYMSIYNFSEVWVIDHSTTTQEAQAHTWWKYNKWGDLVYRFGNPSAYKGKWERLFYSAHHPNLIGSGKVLIFSNGNGASIQESTAYEVQLPVELEKGQSTQKLPEVTWSYTHPDLFFDKVWGVEKLPNGNILITEGDGTLWEVTREKELVWKYNQMPWMFWRTYSYSYDSEAIKSLWLGK